MNIYGVTYYYVETNIFIYLFSLSLSGSGKRCVQYLLTLIDKVPEQESI